MKKTTFLLMLLCASMAFADTSTTIIAVGDTTQMPLQTIIAKGLPVMCFETVDAEEPTCDYVTAPAGCMGAGIANATKVPGRLVIYQLVDDVDSVLYDSGNYEKDVSGMTIKIRGNTSAYDAKKPYKIKLQKKKDLLFRDVDSVYKDKEWLLLRDDYFTTISGLKVNEMVGMTWTPQHHFVNVVINGSYRGIYLLCEAIKRNPDCRLNVDKNSGFIFECDPYWWNESVYVRSNKHPSYNYTFKYPDEDDITEDQLAYMQTLVNRYEASLTANNYPDLIDVRSFAGWCLVHDIEGTQDSGGANRFYTKYDTTDASKIVMPLAWDFDMAEHTTSAWSRSHTSHMNTLFNNSNRAFVGEFAALWRKVRGTLTSEFSNYMKEFRRSAEGIGVDNSIPLDKLVYNRPISVLGFTTARATWITNRRTWLDNAINALNPLGDVNVDGQVNITDITILINALLNNTEDKVYAGDVTEDGAVNISDVIALISQVVES
jgi:hypothetical protein